MLAMPYPESQRLSSGSGVLGAMTPAEYAEQQIQGIGPFWVGANH